MRWALRRFLDGYFLFLQAEIAGTKKLVLLEKEYQFNGGYSIATGLCKYISGHLFCKDIPRYV